MLIHGYLPIMSGWAMAEFLYRLKINFGNIKPFLLQNSERLKRHAEAMARQHGRPFRYLESNIDKEAAARELAQRDGIQLAWCASFRSWRIVAGFPFVSRNRIRTTALSFARQGASVCTCTLISWITGSA